MLHRRRALVALALLPLLAAAVLPAATLDPDNLRTWCGNSGADPVCGGPDPCRSCARSCHSAHFVNSGPGTLSISGLPDPYLPGVEYSLTLTLDDPTNTDFLVGGYQLSALAVYDRDGDTLDDLCQAGALMPGDRSSSVDTDPATETEWLEHAPAKAVSGGATSWDFLWTAPTAAVGVVQMNVCAVAADEDGTTVTDWVYCDAFRVFPETLPCPTFSLSASADPGPGDCETTVTWSAPGGVPPVVYDVEFSAGGAAYVLLPDCTGLTDVTTCIHSGAPWGADLAYRVSGYDSCPPPEGTRTRSDETAPQVRATDATPPAFPVTNASASAVQCDVTVTWDPLGASDACSGVAGFRVYRSSGTEDCAGAGLVAEILDPGAASHVDSVPGDDEYFYWVRAVDAAGSAETNCETASVTVAGCTPPCPPFTIEVTATSGPRECESRVRWTPTGNEGETAYDLFFSADGGPFQPVAGCQGLVDQTECFHTGAPWAADLVYRVEGTDSCPAGGRTVLGETDGPLRVTDRLGPSFPSPSPSASPAGCDVTVDWDPSTAADACSGAAGFRVYRVRGSDSCPAGTLAAEIPDPGASSHLDGVSRDGEWFYWVRAYDAEGNEDGNCLTAPVTVAGCEDAEPMFPPGGVYPDAPGGVVVLEWTGESDSYNVYRGPLGLTGEIVLTTGAYEQLQCSVFGTSATDLGLRDGIDAFYLVVARFLSGAEQGYGCADEDADGACDRDRVEAAAPCP